MVHTIPSMVPVFDDLAKEIMPDVQIVHLTDQGTLKEVLATGEYPAYLTPRLARLAMCAEETGAKAVLLTCSTLGILVGEIQKLIGVPMLKVDEAMADQAVKVGSRIGVIATAHTTLKPTSGLVEERAALAKTAVEVEAVLCEGAYDAFNKGDTATHDRIVLEYLRRLMGRSDVVVLAQASMARVADQIPEEERPVPVLASPRSGVERFKELLDGLP